MLVWMYVSRLWLFVWASAQKIESFDALIKATITVPAILRYSPQMVSGWPNCPLVGTTALPITTCNASLLLIFMHLLWHSRWRTRNNVNNAMRFYHTPKSLTSTTNTLTKFISCTSQFINLQYIYFPVWLTNLNI